MDIASIGAAVALVKSIPGSAAQRAETARKAAEDAAASAVEAASSVTSATVAETKSYLGIE